nr:hypothetical protein Iba_chr07bCG9640 [Ipomoea batatas]
MDCKRILRGALLIEILRFPILVALFNGLSPEFLATGSPPSFELDYSSRVAGVMKLLQFCGSIFNEGGKKSFLRSSSGVPSPIAILNSDISAPWAVSSHKRQAGSGLPASIDEGPGGKHLPKGIEIFMKIIIYVFVLTHGEIVGAWICDAAGGGLEDDETAIAGNDGDIHATSDKQLLAKESMASPIKSTKLSPGCPKAEDSLYIHPDRIEELLRWSNRTGPGGTLYAASISISIGLKRGTWETFGSTPGVQANAVDPVPLMNENKPKSFRSRYSGSLNAPWMHAMSNLIGIAAMRSDPKLIEIEDGEGDCEHEERTTDWLRVVHPWDVIEANESAMTTP